MTKKLLIGAAGAALAFAAPAGAQSIATTQPVLAIVAAKAFGDGNRAVQTQYKAQLDQIDAKRREQQRYLAQLDKNNDKQVDDAELKAAQDAKSPVLAQVDQVNQDINKLENPILLARLYVLEQVSEKFDTALAKIVAHRKLAAVLTPNSFVYLAPNSDITQALTAEIDRIAPSVPTTPPADWKPDQQTVGLFQQLQQLQQLAAQQQAAQAQQQAAGQPAAGAPAPAAPAKPAGKQPQSR